MSSMGTATCIEPGPATWAPPCIAWDSPPPPSRQLQARARDILAKPIDYIPCPAAGPDHRWASPRELANLDEGALLSPQQERDLFLQMNSLKQRADALRRRLSPAEPCGELMDEFERLLCWAEEARNALARVFLKLAASVVRDYIDRRHPFDELLSEGGVALLRAIELFNPSRGFRFSSYCVPAVRRTVQRHIAKEHKSARRAATGIFLDALPGNHRRTASETRALLRAAQDLDGLINSLEDRDQLIIRRRFGLDATPQAESLQTVANQLGVSRERVRQLEQRALVKLRDMADGPLVHA